MPDHEHDLFDLGLKADLTMLAESPIGRRRILRLGATGIGLLLVGCGTQSTAGPAGAPPSGGASASSPTQVSANGACVEIPTETAGPYPADGSNGSNQTLNVLTLSGIVRSDIRTSLTTKNVAAGVPTMVELTLVNVNSNCAPLAGYAVYLWHCNRDGNYSLYSSGVTDEDYLRGVQVADANGKVSFQTIFPACYSGRWPHIHFEIYQSAEKATSSANVVHTSQLAVPEDACNTVFAKADGYSKSVTNLSQITLASDNVFSDGTTSQMATASGSIEAGYSFALSVGVAV